MQNLSLSLTTKTKGLSTLLKFATVKKVAGRKYHVHIKLALEKQYAKGALQILALRVF